MSHGDVLGEDRHRGFVSRVLKILRRGPPFFAVLVVDNLNGVDAPEQSCSIWNPDWIVLPLSHLLR